MAEPAIDIDVADQADTQIARSWVTVVWNDEVNLMSYVVYVFRSYFGYDDTLAHTLMLQVHHEGKAAVAHGDRETMERHVAAMHSFGLWSTLEEG